MRPSSNLDSKAHLRKVSGMKIGYTYWLESDGMYLGYLNEFPEHWTQGTDLEDLKGHLTDLFHLLHDEDVPGIRRVAELEIA